MAVLGARMGALMVTELEDVATSVSDQMMEGLHCQTCLAPLRRDASLAEGVLMVCDAECGYYDIFPSEWF